MVTEPGAELARLQVCEEAVRARDAGGDEGEVGDELVGDGWEGGVEGVVGGGEVGP